MYLCVRLLPHIKGNVGLVFTKADLSDVRKVIDNNKVILNCCILLLKCCLCCMFLVLISFMTSVFHKFELIHVQDVVWHVTTVLLQISCWVCRWKSFETSQYERKYSCLQCFDGQEGHLVGKKLSGGMLMWLCVWVKVQICVWPSWCRCHSLSLAPVL